MTNELNEIKVSVVVPVYNVEKYLDECIKSILNQTSKIFELILVDDGSTDKSGAICDDYGRKFSNVHVIHEENSGQNAARKAGVEIARGEYVLFVDSDDYIDCDLLEKVYPVVEKNNLDIINFGYIREDSNSSARVTSSLPAGLYETPEDLSLFFSGFIYYENMDKIGYAGALCSGLIRKGLAYKYLSSIPQNIRRGEDLAVLWSCLFEAKKIAILSITPYHYRMNYDSVTHSKDMSVLYQFLDWYVYLNHNAKKNENYSIIKKQLEMKFQNLLLNALPSAMDLSVRVPYYFLDKPELWKNKKVILYGAGNVGRDYYQQLDVDDTVDVVAWVDENVKNGITCTPDSIADKEYDIILIAVKYGDMANSIKENLVNIYGADADKVVWIKPECILNKFVKL